MNIAELEMGLEELVEQPFDREEFALALMAVFDAPKATITKLRNARKSEPKMGELGDDVFWLRKMYFRPAPAGQSAQTLTDLKTLTHAKNKAPRFLIATDGQEFLAYDSKTDEALDCDFGKLYEQYEFFLPLANMDKYESVPENPADKKAAGKLALFYDEISLHNPEWTTPEKHHALHVFLTRLLFCMFAEDTGSFEQDLFSKTIVQHGGEDGEYMQKVLKDVFRILNTPTSERGKIQTHLKDFPYVNGGLFEEQTPVPVFSKRAKRLLVGAANLDWKEINADIFGSMIQAVVDKGMRGDLGMHYTSVPNIMKVLQPLFLMSLEEEFDAAKGHREEKSRIEKLLRRIHKIRVFDPACGSGNFLIIA